MCARSFLGNVPCRMGACGCVGVHVHCVSREWERSSKNVARAVCVLVPAAIVVVFVDVVAIWGLGHGPA